MWWTQNVREQTLKKSSREQQTNDFVWSSAAIVRSLDLWQSKRVSYPGWAMGLGTITLQGVLEGGPRWGGQRKTWLADVQKPSGGSTKNLLTIAQGWTEWRALSSAVSIHPSTCSARRPVPTDQHNRCSNGSSRLKNEGMNVEELPQPEQLIFKRMPDKLKS